MAKGKENAIRIGIDPTIDFAFKRVYGSRENTDITTHFLNAVLRGSPTITSLELLNPYLEKDYEADKLSILDVRCSDQFRRKFDIEVQTTMPQGLRQRLPFYNSSMYVDQLEEGEDYVNLRPAISVCVLDAIMFPEAADIHLDFRFRAIPVSWTSQNPNADEARTISLTDDLQIHTLELPKYRRPGDNEKIVDPLEKWLYFLRFAASSTVAELAARLGDEVFVKAAKVLEMIAKTPEERRLYEARVKFERDQRARLAAAEARGERRGEQLGKIQLLQELLGLSPTPEEELAKMNSQQAESLLTQLRQQYDANARK